MGNAFFNDHPFLGSMFDFDRDGSLDIAEAGFMGGMGAMFASEMDRSSREAERENLPWEDDDDALDELDGYDEYESCWK